MSTGDPPGIVRGGEAAALLMRRGDRLEIAVIDSAVLDHGVHHRRLVHPV
jgi:hypothetical protein